jgi:hypothetical protein
MNSHDLYGMASNLDDPGMVRYVQKWLIAEADLLLQEELERSIEEEKRLKAMPPVVPTPYGSKEPF